LVNENVIQVNGINICNQGVPKENNRITYADLSSDNNNANVNPERNKQIVQSSMLMMMNQMQIMTCALFAFKKYNLMQIEDMLIQMDNADACVTIITIV
jgi:hypothetical protein